MAGRKLVHWPVPGFVDLVSILMVLASASADEALEIKNLSITRNYVEGK